MPAGCRVVSEPDDLESIANSLRSLRVLQAAIRRWPVLGDVVRIISPALDLTTHLKRIVVGHSVLRENRQAAIQAAVDHVIATTGSLTDHFRIDRLGFVDMTLSTGRTARLHINDVLEGSLSRFKLNDAQKAALQGRKDVWDDVRHDYNKWGGKLAVEEDLFPRIVLGKEDATGKIHRVNDEYGGGGTVKSGGSFTKERARDATTGKINSSEKMVNEGIRYMDPDKALWQKAQEIGRRTADEQLVAALKQLPEIQKDRGFYPAGVKGDIYGRPGEYIDISHFDGNVIRNLQGYTAPAEVVAWIQDVLKRPANVNIPVLSSISNISRQLVASFDFGTVGLQLLPTIGADMGMFVRRGLKGEWYGKGIFARSAAAGFEAFRDPAFLQKYFSANKEVIDRWASHIGGLRNVEYFGDLTQGGGIVPGLRRVERPFARAFEASLDVAKIEYIKALEALHGKKLSAADMESMGSWVRNLTGQLSSNRLGISGFQQSVESTFLLFSPRYTRSMFGVFGAIFGTNAGRIEAFAALGGLAFAGTVVYIASAQALGQKPRLDPLGPGFMSVKINGNWVGIGGGMRAMSQLVARSYDTARTDPVRFLDFKNANPNDGNPILAFWKNRAAPIISPIQTIWTGSDYKGTPIKSTTDWVNQAISHATPFGFQAALDANGGFGTKTALSFLSGIGAQTSPLSAYQAYNEYLLEQTDAYGVQRFPDGAQTQQTATNNFKEFLAADEQAKFLKDAYNSGRLANGDQSAKIIADRSERINAADAMLAKTGDYRLYRSQINQIRANARTEMEALNMSSARSTGDKKLVGSWYDTFKDPTAVDPVTGGVNSDGLELVQQAWKDAHPGEFERLIEPVQTIGETAMETKLREDRKTISDAGWWDADKKAWATIQNTDYGKKVNLAQYKTYADYVSAQHKKYMDFAASKGLDPVTTADVLLQKDPLASAFSQIRARDRLLLQKAHPEIVKLLALWGYNHVSAQEYGLAATAGG